MLSFCCTKINVGLAVVGKRSDGFHNLESLFFPVPFGDVLEMELSDKNDLQVFGISVTSSKEENFVWKGWRYMQDRFQLPNVTWYLHKVVPAGTGIGAGSANLAEMILMTNRFFNLELNAQEMETIALKFGSDTAFFIQKQPAFVSGRGDVLAQIPFFLEGKYLVLLHPEKIHMSTKEAFASLSLAKSRVNMDFEEAVAKRDISGLCNDFENGFLSMFPQVADLRIKCQHAGAQYFSLSGSGSCFYAIFKEKPDADTLQGLPIIWEGKLETISAPLSISK